MEEQRAIGLDLSLTSADVIEILLEDASDSYIFSEILQANRERPEILRLLYEHPNTPEEIKSLTEKYLNLPVLQKENKISPAPVPAEESEEKRRESLLVKIQRLPVPKRRLLALRGGREIRSILIKDTNKDVVLSVIENPKITESEIEMIARQRSIPEEALRMIASNRDWIKNYSIVQALVSNPKTPPGIAVGLVPNLKTKDLELIERNKNVSEAVRAAAKRLLQVRKPG
ncbi:MAG: hypothetical protein N2257_10505 [Thermodesulfovibrionales bacterium]|nr:hypothetical protein [Thermodesulfovibrionales bacterium]